MEQRLIDLTELIVLESDEPNLTWEQLFEALGFEKNEDGNIDTVKLFNTCWNVQTNPKVVSLPHDKRIHVIRSAAAAMDVLRFGNSG